jgi:hypothetical protein
MANLKTLEEVLEALGRRDIEVDQVLVDTNSIVTRVELEPDSEDN